MPSKIEMENEAMQQDSPQKQVETVKREAEFVDMFWESYKVIKKKNVETKFVIYLIRFHIIKSLNLNEMFKIVFSNLLIRNK